MRKFFLSSVALIAFSVAIMVFEMSCQKTVTAQTPSYTLPPATTTTLGGIIVGNGLSVTGNRTLSVDATTSRKTQLNKLLITKGSDLWIVNYDGTDVTKVNITLPSGVVYDDDSHAVLTPDGKKIFFTAGPVPAGGGSPSRGDLYSCNPDGSNVTKIIKGDIYLVDAY